MAKKATASKTTGLPAGLKSNSEVIREILGKGVLMPAEIQAAAREEYKLSVGKPLINQVKMAWKKANKGSSVVLKKKGRGPGRKKAAGGNEVGNQVVGDVRGNGLTELEAAKFALKMGGIEQAVAVLQNLMK